MCVNTSQEYIRYSREAATHVAKLLHVKLRVNYILLSLIICIFEYSYYTCKHLLGIYQVFLMKPPPCQDMAPKIKLK